MMYNFLPSTLICYVSESCCVPLLSFCSLLVMYVCMYACMHVCIAYLYLRADFVIDHCAFESARK